MPTDDLESLKKTKKLDRELLDLAVEHERLHRRIEILDAEKCFAISRYESAVRLLTGIHSLLYPPAINLADGRTMVFRPTDPDPHAILQELSDRIRAIPDEIYEISYEDSDE